MLDSLTDVLGKLLLSVLSVLVVIAWGSLLLQPLIRRWRQVDKSSRSFGHAELGNGTTYKLEQWDFFVSYKSEDANIVRRVVERLTAGGFRVWFAEHEVLLRNYDAFTEAIKYGTENCSFALLFTSARYSASQYCRQEVDWLRQSLGHAPEHIIEISLEEPNDGRMKCGIPPSSPRLVPDLPALIADDRGQEVQLFNALAICTGFDLSRCRPDQLRAAETTQFCARCTEVGFDTSGFYLDTWQKHPADGTDVARFLSLDPEMPLEFNVYFDFSMQYGPGKPYSIATGPVADDRKLYDERRQFASWWMQKMSQEYVPLAEKGLHLFWRNQQTHIALTHRYADYWMRKYSLLLADRGLSHPTEVIFTFGLRGDFEFFCRHACLMDHIVESVQVTEPLARTTTVRRPGCAIYKHIINVARKGMDIFCD